MATLVFQNFHSAWVLNALGSVKKDKINGRVHLRIKRISKPLSERAKEFQQEVNRITEEYAELDEDGEVVYDDDDKIVYPSDEAAESAEEDIQEVAEDYFEVQAPVLREQDLDEIEVPGDLFEFLYLLTSDGQDEIRDQRKQAESDDQEDDEE